MLILKKIAKLPARPDRCAVHVSLVTYEKLSMLSIKSGHSKAALVAMLVADATVE